MGSIVKIEQKSGPPIDGEVVGFRQGLTLVCPLRQPTAVRLGNRVRLAHWSRFMRVGDAFIGRVLDAYGHPLDNLTEPPATDRIDINQVAPPALDRPRIDKAFSTGVRAIDALLTCGRGQRMGIVGDTESGKTALLGTIARHCDADVNVLALVGSSQSEVDAFIREHLTSDALARSVVIVAKASMPALMRVHAALAAAAIAEYFRDKGRSVMLGIDSIGNFAKAQNEIAAAIGEAPAARGYAPSVLAALPKLLSRAGQTPEGAVTGFFTTQSGNEAGEPICDLVRSLLDGHIALSSELAKAGVQPPINVRSSRSRLAQSVASGEQFNAANQAARWLESGGARQSRVRAFLQQSPDQPSTLSQATQQLLDLVR